MEAREPASLRIDPADETTLKISFVGAWLGDGRPLDGNGLIEQIRAAGSSLTRIEFDSSALSGWDSGFVTLLLRLSEWAGSESVAFDDEGVPGGARRLLRLAQAVPEREGARREPKRRTLLSVLGGWAIAFFTDLAAFVTFIGEWLLALLRFFTGRARFRWVDFGHFLQSAGVEALPIVSLISLLVGAVLAFVGAVQLQMFGAQIYVANLVGLGMVREMGAMMTAIIMAGRTGSAYAAQLGSMQVNEEVDALRTFGISPMEYLVLPRSLSLILMLPLLCIWSDVLGIVGGLIVAAALLDISLLHYLQQTQEAINLMDVLTGMIKGLIFAVVIALSGCLRGLQSERNSAAVGEATTSAMVTAILLIVVWDAITTIIYNRLGI
ncbi:phospholipid/cholesterol/gamma-HCH transport system permease protein [endosymbiont of Ridgeia piscesae]|uniref:Phospholipid/cholesterol/gamma-HCH transport system permease protein n=1 Tax=endosymbiont of Ridgeia piscesae TaxID=54398 RepID=A0A0T5Z8F9_9GAMM|nr:phospholipid/cholesterol/gamma-HCH transport system permease protein [endosymbiont of Ridgeia piscesae]